MTDQYQKNQIWHSVELGLVNVKHNYNDFFKSFHRFFANTHE